MASLPRPFGRYILEKRIAMGGMAEIFRGRTRQEGFAKTVCIKRVLPSFLKEEDFVKMFRDEAALVARLQHANVVQVFDFGEAQDEGDEDPSLFLVMELVDGCDLKKLISLARKRGAPIGIAVATQIAIEMCRGLHHAHSLTIDGRVQNLIHRDVSPHNILVSRQGEVKVTDFGIAKAAERATHTSTGIVKGKISYMAPEQLEGAEIDHRLDQFAAGVVIWEMLTGRRLFDGDSDATILRQVMMCDIPAPSTVRGDIPPQLEGVLLKALAPSPDERHADMRAFEQELTRFLYSFTSDPADTDVRALVAELLDKAPARKTALVQRKKSSQASAPDAPNASAPNASEPNASAPNARAPSASAPPVATDQASSVSLTAAAAIDDPATSSDVFAAGGAAEPALVDDTSPTAPDAHNILANAATDVHVPAMEEGVSVSAVDATAALHSGEIFSNPPIAAEVVAAQSQTRTLAIGTDAILGATPVAAGDAGAQSSAGPISVAPGDEKRGPPIVAMAAVGGFALVGALGLAMFFGGNDGAEVDPPLTIGNIDAPDDVKKTAPKPEAIAPSPDAVASTDTKTKSSDGDAANAAASEKKPETETAAATDVATKTDSTKTVASKTKKKPARRRRSRKAPTTTTTEKKPETTTAPKGTGLLRILVKDSWANIYENGKLVGETPLTKKFSAGRHRFTLKNPETGKSASLTVEVKSGGKHVKTVKGL